MKKWLISGMEQGKYQLSLIHLMMPENKKVLKERKKMEGRWRKKRRRRTGGGGRRGEGGKGGEGAYQKAIGTNLKTFSRPKLKQFEQPIKK